MAHPNTRRTKPPGGEYLQGNTALPHILVPGLDHRLSQLLPKCKSKWHGNSISDLLKLLWVTFQVSSNSSSLSKRRTSLTI